MTLVPFLDAERIADRFLDLLKAHGITPPLHSTLEDELLSLSELLDIAKNPTASQKNHVRLLRTAAGLHDLAAKVLSVEPLSDFATFVPHLELVASTKVSAASLVQNAASDYNDDTARKFADLYLGCLAAHVGRDVVLDSPTNAKGDNPDVIFSCHPTEGDPIHWALAVKTIASTKGQTIFERIQEGAKQIDSPACGADYGMVVINTKSALDHDALWNTPFPDLASAMGALDAQMQMLITEAEKDRPQKEWDDLFRHRVVRPVLFLGQSLVKLPTLVSATTPTALKMLKLYDAKGSLDPVGGSLAWHMNDYMQKILLGIPGKQGKEPC